MSFLVARIDHALTRGINWLTTSLVERARGFSSGEAGDFLDETCLSCGKLYSERFCRPGVEHGGKYPDWMRDADALAESYEAGYEVAEPRGRACRAPGPFVCLGCPLHGACEYPQTPTAGQRGESPIGDDSPTSSIGSPAWVDWATPVICDVLAEHAPIWRRFDSVYECVDTTTNAASVCSLHGDERAWREHVAPLIAERIKAAAAQADQSKFTVGIETICRGRTTIIPGTNVRVACTTLCDDCKSQ